MTTRKSEDTTAVVATNATVDKYRRYNDAYFAKSSWTAEERRLKADLLKDLGMDDDEKPSPFTAVDANGEPVFVVKVGNRKALDIKYLQEKYPEIYAECEKWTYPVSIRSAE